MNIDCNTIRSQFTSRGLNLNSNTGKIKEYTVDGKTTKCNTCSIFSHGRPVTLSQDGVPRIVMKTCETNYNLIICTIVGVCILLLVVVVTMVHTSHRKLMRNVNVTSIHRVSHGS